MSAKNDIRRFFLFLVIASNFSGVVKMMSAPLISFCMSRTSALVKARALRPSFPNLCCQSKCFSLTKACVGARYTIFREEPGWLPRFCRTRSIASSIRTVLPLPVGDPMTMFPSALYSWGKHSD